MQDLPILFAIAGFTVMGVGAIAKPAFVTAQFGILDLTPAGRNEVRAVYGGFGIFMAPGHFYALTPGVSLFGPFNEHFILDVGLVYVSSGLVGLYGVRSGSVPVSVVAALWSCLHAVFHLHVWVDRGLPLDGVFLFDLSFVIVPPFLVVLLLLRVRGGREMSR